MEDRTGRLVVTGQHTDRFIVGNDKMNSYTVAESDMSLETRSFLHGLNDRERKMLDQSSKDATNRQRQTICDMGMLMSSTLQAPVFMGKEYSEILRSINNTRKDLTMKQMFDISEKLILEKSDVIYGVNTINWGDSSWKHVSMIGDEEDVSLSHAKVFVFSDSEVCYGNMSENPQSNTVWEDKLTWFKSSSQ